MVPNNHLIIQTANHHFNINNNHLQLYIEGEPQIHMCSNNYRILDQPFRIQTGQFASLAIDGAVIQFSSGQQLTPIHYGLNTSGIR